MGPDYLPTDQWLVTGIGWESRRLAPIIEDLDPEGTVPPSREQMMEVIGAQNPTEEMLACQQAAEAVLTLLEGDDGLRQRFAARGVEHLNVNAVFVDFGWEPTFASPRYTFKHAKQFLEVDAWYIYDGPIEPEAFGSWMYSQILGDLERWLKAH
jgi:hypothetical protein